MADKTIHQYVRTRMLLPLVFEDVTEVFGFFAPGSAEAKALYADGEGPSLGENQAMVGSRVLAKNGGCVVVMAEGAIAKMGDPVGVSEKAPFLGFVATEILKEMEREMVEKYGKDVLDAGAEILRGYADEVERKFQKRGKA